MRLEAIERLEVLGIEVHGRSLESRARVSMKRDRGGVSRDRDQALPPPQVGHQANCERGALDRVGALAGLIQNDQHRLLERSRHLAQVGDMRGEAGETRLDRLLVSY